MKTPWKKILAAAVVVGSAPASAIPVTFDFSGTVAHIVNFGFAAGPPTFDLSTMGQAFSAQFIIDTDLFGPAVPGTSDTSDRLIFNSALPGAVNSSLVVNGEGIDFAPYSGNRANTAFFDSNGVVSCGENCSRIAPDQFNVNLISEESTPLGPAAMRSLSFSYVAGFQGFDNPESAMTWFDFSPDFDITQLASLPLLDSLRASVLLTDYLFDCAGERCQLTGTRQTVFNVTSATRTVESVPEPATFGLLAFGIAGAWFTRRRRPQRA
jgi:hypothetical protein